MTSHATDPRPVRRVSAVTASGAISQEDFDPVVVEAPLSIAIDGQVLATTMRTPGHDEDLAVGWLASETDLAARSIESGAVQLGVPVVAASSGNLL